MSANSSEVLIGVLKETAWGVLPSPAPFQLLRMTGESLRIDRENVVSQEMRPDGNVADLIQVGGGASGGINFELSYGTFDDLIEGMMRSAWGGGSPANVIKNAQVEKSFQIKKKIEAGTTDVYYLHSGMEVDTMTLNVQAKQIVTGSFGFIGKGGTVGTTDSGTDVAAGTEPVLNASSHFTLAECGVSPAPELLSVTLNIANGLAARPKIGSVDNIGVRRGQFRVTGSFTAYFANKALADMYLAGTSGGIEFTVGADTGKKYKFEIPKFKLVSEPVNASGNDQDVVYQCEFQGIYDSGIAATLQITRGVA